MIAKALKEKTLELRKARDPMATFLIAVGSKAKDLAKTEDPAAVDFTDEHALRAINSYVKGAEDNMALLREAQDSPLYTRAVEERELLKSFLPEEASADTVRKEVELFVKNADASVDRKKLMGPIMKHINDKFGAALNKKEASGIVQSVLNS